MSPRPSATTLSAALRAGPSRTAARGFGSRDGAAAPEPRDAASGASAPRRAARLFGVSALALAAALAGLQPLSALAGPQGGKVKRGEARIETRGGVTTIRQGGSKVVIDWESFDVGTDEVVRFLQPGRDSVALNRVLDAAPSHIRGRLEANGNVWLINRHGVIFHQSSVVNVGGLLASTADITDDDFMAGRYEFGIPGAPGARVVAEGEIGFADHGLVGLIGAHAENRGVIRGRVGQVVVAGAETYAVDLAGDGLFAFEFDQATAGVSAAQAGEIVNAGGEVLISAASADAMVDNVVSVEGVVSADLADGAGGSVTVSAPGGEALVAGEVSARGGDGGRIDVRARDVDVTGTARLDVSGSARGGAAVILAEERMAFAGTALARGAESGGFVETSGAEVSVTGRVSAGPGGTWLIDPTDIDIGGGDDDVTAASARAAIEDGTGLVVETVDTGGEAGNITVFGAALAGLDLAPGVSESSITLLADGQVVLAGSGGITQAAGDGGALSVTLVTPAGTGGIAQGAAPITLGAGSVLRLEGGAAESLPDFSADLLVAVTADSYLARANGAVVLQPGSDVDPADLLPVLESGGTATLESIGDNVRVVDGLDAISVNAGESAALSLIAEGNVTLANPDGSIGRAAGPQGALTLSITSQDLNINGASTLSVIGGDVLRLTRRGDATLAGNAGVTFDTRTFDFWEVGATVEFAATAFGGASGDLTVEGGFSDATAVNVPAGLTGAVGLFAEGQLAFANASGGVVQTPGGGAFDLTLRADTFSFDAGEPIEVAAGGSVSITGLAAADIGLRDITAPELSVVSGLGIRQNGTTGLVVSGSASFVGAGAGDLVLGDGDLANASNANDFASVSAVTGSGDVSLDDVGGMIVGDVAGGALDLLSDGAVTQQAGTTVVVGAATLEAAGVTLEEAGNAFAELEATAPGQAVSIRDDAGDLLLGDVVAGSFDLLAAGAVDQRDAGLATGSALSVGGAVAISAGGAVDLDNTANAIGAASVLAPGFAVEITDSAGALGLGSVAASSLTLRASGAVTQTPGTTVEVATLADLSTTAGGVTLGEAGNAFATVDVSAPGDVTIDDDDGGITLAGVSGADVTIRTQGAVVLSGAFAATGDALISAVAPAGPAPDIDLTGPGISFASIGAEAVGGAGRGAVSLASASGITLGRVTAATLVVAAEGSIDQLSADPADRIDVSGAASFVQSSPLLQSVDLSNPSNEFSSLQIFSAGPLDVVSIADATAVTLGDISVQTALTVEAAGGIVDGGLLTAPTAVFRAVGPGADVTLDFGHDFGAVTLAAGGDVVVNDTDAALFSGLQLNAVDAGSLFVTTPGAVTQPLVADGAGVVVGGETFIQQGALFPVLLSDVDNDFGSVRLGGFAPTVDLRDRTGIALDGIATTVLDVTAGGDVTDIAPLSASALAVRVTGGGDVLLDAANAFGTASVDAAGGGVALRDADGGGLVLGNLRAASLAVLANGPVTQSFGTSVGTAGAPVADAEITALNGGPRDVTLTGANDFDRLSVIGSAVAVNDVDGLALVDSRAERSLSVTAGGALELTRVSVDGLGGAFLQTLSATGASIAATDLVTDLGSTALTATGGDVSLSEFSVAGLDLTLNLPGTRTLLMRLGEVGDLGFSVPVVRELTLDGVVFAGGIRGGAFATPGRVEAADLVRLDRVRTPGFLDVVAGGVQLGRIDAPALSVTATGGAGISTFTGLLGDVAAGDRVAFAAPVAPAPPATAGDGRTRPGPGQPALDGGGAYAALVDVPGTTTLFAVAPGASVALDQGVTVALGGGPVTLENDFGTVQGAADAGFALRDASALRLGGIDVANGGVTVEAATVSAGALDGAGAAIFADTATVSTGVAGSDVTLTGPNDVDALNATVAGVLTFRDLDGLALGPIAADDVRLDAATASAGALTQTAGITTGTLAVSTSAGASDIVLTQLNAVDRLEASSSGSLSFREADALALGPMTAAGDVTLEAAVSAAGALTQTDPLSAGRLEVSTAQPGSPITLGEANAVDVLAAVATGTLAFLDASGGLDLAGVSAPSLDLETAGALTQSAPVTADAAGASSLRAASILLTLSGNEFGALDARTLDPDGPGALPRGDLALAEDAGGVHSRLLGGAVDVAVAGGDVTLDDVDAETLSVFAGNGPILQTPTGITVAGRSDFVSVGPAFGVILETSAANDFGGRVDATADAGARIGILDSAGDLFLGDLSGGEIVAAADDAVAGSILHAPGATLAAGPGFAVRLSAAGDVEVEDVTGAAFAADAGGAFSQRAGTSLIDVDASAAITAGGDADLGDVEAQDLTVLAAGDVTQRAGQSILTIGGTASLESAAGSVTLEEGVAGDLIATAADDVVQRAGAAGHAVSGSVTIDAGRDVLLGDLGAGTLDVVAGRDVAQQAGASTVTVAGPASLQAGEDVRFDLFASDGLDVTSILGTVEQTAGGAVTATGTTDLVAPSGGVALDVFDNDFDLVSVEAGGAGVALADRDDVALGRISGSVVDVSALGAIAQTAGTSLAASGPARLVSGASVTLGDLSVFDLSVTAPAGVAQLPATSVGAIGGARIASGGPVRLGTPRDAADPLGNVFGGGLAVEATAPDVLVEVEAAAMDRFDAAPGSVSGASIADVLLVVGSGDLALGRVEAATLDVALGGGALGQTADGVVVRGLARFDTSATPGAGIALDASVVSGPDTVGVNDFDTVEAAAGPGGDVSLRDASALRPGVVDGRIVGLRLGDVSGDALSFALDEGALIQAPGSVIEADTSTFVAATDAILTEEPNRLGVFTGLTIDGTVDIESLGALVLADVAADDVVIRAGGTITQAPGSVLLIGRRTDVETTIGDVRLTNPGNDFGALGVADAALTGAAPGRVRIIDVDDLVVVGLTSDSVRLVSRGGAVLARDVTSAGDATLRAATGASLRASEVRGAADVAATAGEAEIRRSTVTGDLRLVSELGDAALSGATVLAGDVSVEAAGTAALSGADVTAGDVRVRAGDLATLESVRAQGGAMDVRAGVVTIGGAGRPSLALSVLAVARDGPLLIDGLRTDGGADLRSDGDLVASDLVLNRRGLAVDTAETPFAPEGAEPGSFVADLQAGGRVVLTDANLREGGSFVVRGRGGDPRAGAEVAIDGLRVAGSAHVGATEAGPGAGEPGSPDPRALTIERLALDGVARDPVDFGDDPGQTQALVAEDAEMTRILADRDGLLHLLVGEPGRPGDVRIVSEGELGLRVEPDSALGDVEIGFDRDAAGSRPDARTLEIFDVFASADRPAGRVTILDAHDVTVGRTTAPGVEGGSILSLALEADGALGENLFYAEALSFVGADGIVLLDRDFAVNERFLEDTRYSGLVLTDNLFYDASPELRGLDLAGSIAGSDRRAAGIDPVSGTVPSGPPPPESTDFLFNRCEIGNFQDCSSDPPPTARIDAPQPEPPDLFVLDLAELADVYASFGNEELWAAPPAFTVDLAEQDDDQEDAQ